jgi:VanZ family protein
LKIIRYWLPVVLLLTAIFFLSSTPGDELHRFEFPFAHFIAHAVEYFLMGFLVCRALTADLKIKKPVLASIILVIIYAITDEWHQSFVPGRSPAAKDVVLDLISGAFGAFLLLKNSKSR